MLYRLYRPDDFPALYAIEELCFQPPFRFSRGLMRRLVSSAASATWIAEENDQLAGFAIVKWSQESEQTIAYIQTIEVAPAQRFRGIARELLGRLEASAAAAGAQVIWLHVAEANTAAIRLYESHGYLIRGREDDYYAKDIPALVYAKTASRRN
jgi:ribosomal protein S18 acetylase RimI-like enzyme